MASRTKVLQQSFKTTSSTRASNSTSASSSSSSSSSFFPLSSSVTSTSKPHPPTSTWYTSRPTLNSTLSSLETSLNQSRTHLFKSGLLRSINQSLTNSPTSSAFPHPRTKKWKDPKQMGVYLRNGTDLRTSEYKKLTNMLSSLEGLLPYANLADRLPKLTVMTSDGRVNTEIEPPSLVIDPVALHRVRGTSAEVEESEKAWKEEQEAYRGDTTTLSQQLDSLLSKFTAPAIVSATGTTVERVSGAARRLGKIDHFGRVNGVGRRKESTARVWIIPASASQPDTNEDEVVPGRILVNLSSLPEYFGVAQHRSTAIKPLTLTSSLGVFNVFAIVEGGGIAAQADAVAMATARALAEWERTQIEKGLIQEGEVTWRELLKKAELIDRDPRMVERKKTGQAKARKKFAWVKR